MNRHVSTNQRTFVEMFVFISKALSSSDSEVVCDGLWLLCTANEISAHRQDVHVDPCFTLVSIYFGYLDSQISSIVAINDTTR
jgi:hypothetical protein